MFIQKFKIKLKLKKSFQFWKTIKKMKNQTSSDNQSNYKINKLESKIVKN